MKKISNIAHPLKNRTGLSQRTRINSALAFDTAPVDGKSLADRLVMIRNYSRYVNFYELSSNQREGDFQNISDWASFFKESLPFQLAILSKVNTEDVMQEFFALLEELKAHPSEQSLTLVLEYIFNNFVAPVHELYTAVIIENNSFHETLLSIIKSGFLEPLITFVCLYNTSANFLCVKKRNFNDLLQEPWQLKVDQIYAIDTCVIQVRRGKKEAFQKIGAALEGIFYKFFSGLEFIISSAPDYIQESLVPLEESLQERHQPHVALLFTFLELFKHFQGNINELGKKHLDFFYQQVLKMKPKAAEPDKAHIIFELAKHLKAYPLKKDLLLKDGKDKNKQDIQFGLDHELILDHAKIADLRTLSLHPVKENKDFLEGLYIAPVANSLDGVGKEFVEGQAKNWSTLGSKLSKFKPEGENEFQEHPPARLGFVLASPVLLLQEGRRTIIISLECSSDEDFFEKISALYDSMPAYKITENSADEFRALFPSNYRALDLAVSSFNSLLEKQVHEKIFKKDLDAFLLLKKEDGSELFTASKKTAIENLFLGLETIIGLVKLPLFKFSFSGEEKWLEPKVENITVFISSSPGMLNFEIEIILDNDFPSVTFFNEEILEEKIDIREVHPLVKIELNEAILVACENPETDDKNCCLRGPREQFPMLDVSPYQLLKNLKIKDAKIEVEVCGVKNLIAQNDEGALDINGQLFPFGLRPNVPGFDPMNQVKFPPPTGPAPPPERETNPLEGPSFYLASKEVFYKKWNVVRVNIEWKDKPDSFHDHYKAYLKEKNAPPDTLDESKYGLNEDDFQLKLEKLSDGLWHEAPNSKIKLFHKSNEDFGNLECDTSVYAWEVENDANKKFVKFNEPLRLFKNSLNGFLKFTLSDQDFLHKEYPFVLARQMLAYANIEANGGKKLTDAIYIEKSGKTVISPFVDFLNLSIEDAVNNLLSAITPIMNVIPDIENILGSNTVIVAVTAINTELQTMNNAVIDPTTNPAQKIIDVKDSIQKLLVGDIMNPLDNGLVANALVAVNTFTTDLMDVIGVNIDEGLKGLINDFKNNFMNFHEVVIGSNLLNFFTSNSYQALIPNEPWTPIIKNLYVDYSASAIKEDIELIHLYPYDNTSKFEDIEDNQTTLFPIFDDEGTLFIGIEQLTLGGSISILFQLAEATADSEQDRALIKWHYLSNNTWKELRPGFEVIADGTEGLTVSGIVTIAVPNEIKKEKNTVMPNTLDWIKISTPVNTSSVAEIIGVHCQAAKASARLKESHDKTRLNKGLEAGSIGKLVESDFSVKKVEQRYDSFGGRLPEAKGHFYTRVSEQLKHKDRSLMLTDYEKIVLEGFPQIYKVKCISHTMGLSANEYHRDLEIAPGFVIVAVIPDLTKLESGNLQEPKVPLSLLEKIADHIRKRTSPFARLKVMNPRFEYVDVELSVRLYRGKNENFHKEKLEEDVRLFLAPWFLGDSEKLAFGQVILFSDLVGFIEQLDYVDYIVNIELNGQCDQTGELIKPLTARSILTGGSIAVTIDKEDCSERPEISSELIGSTIN